MTVTTPAPHSGATDPLLAPFQLKHLRFRNRIMSTSHACGLAVDGMPADRYQSYHEAKAKGGIALTMFGGSSNVSPDSQWNSPQLNLHDDRIVPHFQRFADRVHAHDALLMCQVSHLGGRGDPHAGARLAPIGPSPVRETLHRAFAREMDEHDIARVVADYAEAAARCKAGGLDGMETLTGAHLIGQFFSPATNRRRDRFGGSVENRCRFGVMVHEAIRERVGDDFVVGIRFVVDEAGPGHLDFDECLEIARILEASGTIDFFNAIYGRMDTQIKLAVDCMPGMASPMAPFLSLAGAFKQAVSMPVFHATRITELATARHAIREGLLDMVAMTRAHIAEPALAAKLARGEEARARPCVGATHCMSEMRPTCLHNPSTGHERELPHEIEPAPTKRRVLVAGGGPAGLEAARVCAERGHDVRLVEASGALGGQVLLATQASWRRDLIGIVDWRIAELEHFGVEVQFNRFLDAEAPETEEAEVVIVATGGLPDLDWVDGAAHCTSVWDILGGTVKAAGEVIVYDGTGRHAALIGAEKLRLAGCEVAFFGLDGQLAMEMSYAEQVIWRRRSYELGIEAKLDRRLERVERHGNRLRASFRNDLTDEQETHEADQIVIEHGTRPADDLFQALRARSSNRGVVDERALIEGGPQPGAGTDGFQLFRIGDAVSSRNIHAAVLDAYRLCRVL